MEASLLTLVRYAFWWTWTCCCRL